MQLICVLLLTILGLCQGLKFEYSKCFPSNFLFGTATAAYQVEGGWNATGRSPSIWDSFCREKENLQCANVADDMLHRYNSDLQLMASMGLNSFRFSVSWSRVMHWDPQNPQKMKPNPLGIAFYRSLIQEIHKHRMEPILTMYHWDLPQELHTELTPSGWLNPKIVDYFADYARLLLTEFGRDVKYWATFNEPWTFTTQGYGSGTAAPGIKNSTTKTYIATHNVLLSHGQAVAVFRKLKKNKKKTVRNDARISIVLNCDHAFPMDNNNPKDVAAAERKMQFSLGWYLNPIVKGDYPSIMKEYSGDHLPTFSPEQSALVKGSYDLLMLNHYSSSSVTDCDSPTSTTKCSNLTLGWERDMATSSVFPEGARASSKTNGNHNCVWFNGYPDGYLQTIRWMHSHDKSANILLTENGWCGNETVDNYDQLWYYQTYLNEVYKAINEGIPVIGYTAWSFLDNYEWGSFIPRFGLFHVDFPKETGSKEGYVPNPNQLKRTPRIAAKWYSLVAKTKCLVASSLSNDIETSKIRSFSSAAGYVGGVICYTALVIGSVIFVQKWRNVRTGERRPLI